jgi:hypothetical protein
MQRKILLIHNEISSGRSSRNNSRTDPIGFDWFKKLINSNHHHVIKILVVDYVFPRYYFNGWSKDKFDDWFFSRMIDYIEDYYRNEEISTSGVEVLFGDDVLKMFSLTIQEKMKEKLRDKGINLIDPDEFFLDAVNEGFEIFF